MTEYVLKRYSDILLNANKVEITDQLRIKEADFCIRYANLLSTLLSLNQFIPCNKDGEPMEKPLLFENFRQADKALKSHRDYLKAMDSVIISGFKIKQRPGYKTLQKIGEDIPMAECYDDSTEWDWYEHKTIEDFIKYELTLINPL